MSDYKDKIAALKKEIADLEEQERREKEEEILKLNKEMNNDLQSIMDSIEAFNKKYSEQIYLTASRASKVGNHIMDIYFPWRHL